MQNEPNKTSETAENDVNRNQPQDWITVGENLIRYVPSGTYYARIRAGGKLNKKSLKTDVHTTAKLRLADYERELRQMAERQAEVSKGKMTFGEAVTMFLQRKDADASLAPNTKLYYRNLSKALLKSWPALKTLDIRKLKKHDCILWAGRFADSVSATAYNNTIGMVKSSCDIAVENGARLDNPANDLKRVTTMAKPLKLPSSEQWISFVKSVGSSNS